MNSAAEKNSCSLIHSLFSFDLHTIFYRGILNPMSGPEKHSTSLEIKFVASYMNAK